MVFPYLRNPFRQECALSMTFLRLASFLLLVLLWIPPVSAQVALDDLDFSRTRVDDLTDAQILKLLERAQEEGFTLSEIERMALARGMKPSEVIKLRQRLRTAQSRQRESGPTRRRRGAADARDEDEPEDPLDILLQSRRSNRGRDRSQARPQTRPQTRPRDRRDAFAEADTTGLFADSLYDERALLFEEEDELRIFGSDLFQSEMLTFEPSLNIPTPADYQLGPGDELVIDIWGAAEMTYTVPVTREGTVRIENLGPIQVSGLPVEAARERILGRLAQLYAGLNASGTSESNVFADVTLGKIRSIKVHIIGEVTYPGSYTLPAVANVFNALYVCSGPSETGTYRRIQVLRGGAVVAELDVYDFLVYGRQDGNIRLRDQDIIKVDPYLARVTITGEVKRPGLFEVRQDETLADLVRFAGSFNGQAYTRRLKVYRNTATERRILDVNATEFDRFPLADGDEVFVDPILERFANRVEIQGAVFREGDYELDDAPTVYALIQRAEGLRGDAFVSRGQIYRTRDDFTLEMISFDLAQLMADPERYDVALRKDDSVVIPSIFDLQEQRTLTIEGSVQQEGAFPYMDSMTLKDLIVLAGGFKEEASLLRVEVARRRTDNTATDASGKIADIFYFDVDRDLTLGPEGDQFVLEPFDQVFVRRSPGYIEQRIVKLTGEVLYPGAYSIASKEDRISDLIRRAGGLTPEAYPQGARLIRTRDQTGPVGINLDRIMTEPLSNYDLLVEDGDSIHVPLRLETVKVSGAVYFPVNVRYIDGLDLMDYVGRAGGATDQADLKKAYVVYANGSVDRINKGLFLTHYPRMEPGAEIVVPVKPEEQKMSAQERTLIWSSIVSVAAVVSTTIFQILNARSSP